MVPRQVELEHSRFSGKKKVFVDGKPVFATTEKQLSWCWEHPNTKAKILLESENGRHSLRCEEPEKLEQGPNEQLQSVSPRSCRSTTSVTGSRRDGPQSLKRDRIYCSLSVADAIDGFQCSSETKVL